MDIAVASGAVSGTYTTAVSSSGCVWGDFPIAGRADVDETGLVNVGCVVSWGKTNQNAAP